MRRGEANYFANQIERARTARGLSMRGAARAGGLSEATWRRYAHPERHPRLSAPREDTLHKIATALHVPVHQVWHWAGQPFDGIDPPKPLAEALAEHDGRDGLPHELVSAWGEMTEHERGLVLALVDALVGRRGQPTEGDDQ